MAAFRLDPALLDAMRERTSNLTQAIEEAIRLWLARERRKDRTDRLATDAARDRPDDGPDTPH